MSTDDERQRSDKLEPRITMNHYHSTRRIKRRPTWPYAISAVLMLATLVLVLLFQDSCGSTISDSVFQVNQ